MLQKENSYKLIETHLAVKFCIVLFKSFLRTLCFNIVLFAWETPTGLSLAAVSLTGEAAYLPSGVEDSGHIFEKAG